MRPAMAGLTRGAITAAVAALVLGAAGASGGAHEGTEGAVLQRSAAQRPSVSGLLRLRGGRRPARVAVRSTARAEPYHEEAEGRSLPAAAAAGADGERELEGLQPSAQQELAGEALGAEFGRKRLVTPPPEGAVAGVTQLAAGAGGSGAGVEENAKGTKSAWPAEPTDFGLGAFSSRKEQRLAHLLEDSSEYDLDPPVAEGDAEVGGAGGGEGAFARDLMSPGAKSATGLRGTGALQAPADATKRPADVLFASSKRPVAVAGPPPESGAGSVDTPHLLPGQSVKRPMEFGSIKRPVAGGSKVPTEGYSGSKRPMDWRGGIRGVKGVVGDAIGDTLDHLMISSSDNENGAAHVRQSLDVDVEVGGGGAEGGAGHVEEADGALDEQGKADVEKGSGEESKEEEKPDVEEAVTGDGRKGGAEDDANAPPTTAGGVGAETRGPGGARGGTGAGSGGRKTPSRARRSGRDGGGGAGNGGQKIELPSWPWAPYDSDGIGSGGLGIHPVLGFWRNFEKAAGLRAKDDTGGLGSTVQMPEDKILGFEGDVRDYFDDYLEQDVGFIRDGDADGEAELAAVVDAYNTSVGRRLKSFTAQELARKLTEMAVEDGTVAARGALAHAKYLTAMTKTCEQVLLHVEVFSDVETVKCLPRAGGAHLLLTSFSAHLFVDADGFCGQSRGWAAEALSDEQRLACMNHLCHIVCSESHVRVRGINAAWDDATARPPMPPRIFEMRHLLTDEALCDPANDMMMPINQMANYTLKHQHTACEAALAEKDRERAAHQASLSASNSSNEENGRECQGRDGASEFLTGMEMRAQQGLYAPEQFLGSWACPHARGSRGEASLSGLPARARENWSNITAEEESLALLLEKVGIDERAAPGDSGDVHADESAASRDGQGDESESATEQMLKDLNLCGNALTRYVLKESNTTTGAPKGARKTTSLGEQMETYMATMRKGQLPLRWAYAASLRALLEQVLQRTQQEHAAETALGHGQPQELAQLLEETQQHLALMKDTQQLLLDVAASHNITLVNASVIDGACSADNLTTALGLARPPEMPPDEYYESREEVEEGSGGKRVWVKSPLVVARHDLAEANCTWRDFSEMVVATKEGGLRSRVSLTLSLEGQAQSTPLRRVVDRWDASCWSMLHGVGRLLLDTITLQHTATAITVELARDSAGGFRYCVAQKLALTSAVPGGEGSRSADGEVGLGEPLQRAATGPGEENMTLPHVKYVDADMTQEEEKQGFLCNKAFRTLRQHSGTLPIVSDKGMFAREECPVAEGASSWSTGLPAHMHRKAHREMWAAEMAGGIGQAIKIQHVNAAREAQALYLSPLGFIWIGKQSALVVDARGDLPASVEEAMAIVKMWGAGSLLNRFARGLKRRTLKEQ